MHLPFDPVVPLQRMYPMVGLGTCTQFVHNEHRKTSTAKFIIAKERKQPKYPLIGDWLNNFFVHPYNMVLYNAVMTTKEVLEILIGKDHLDILS